MILDKNIEIKTTNKNISHYKNLGYDIKSGDTIVIPISHLPIGSHKKIMVSCQCNIKKIEYRLYYKLTNKFTTQYYCNKCKQIKIVKTNLKKYGVSNVFQNIEIKEKIKKTNINKYGVPNPFMNKTINKKIENTNLKNYNTKYPITKQHNKHDKNHDKLKKTVTLKYSKIFEEKSSLIHGNKYTILSPYINMITKVDFYCNKCNTIFTQRPKDHINNKQGCPICKESKGGKRIRIILNKNNIIYETQKTFKECTYKKKLKFDFYLPNYNICIEYDGEQHYKSFEYFGGIEALKIRQKRDKIKNEYCKENTINLIRIKYNDNIENKINKLLNDIR